MRNLLTRARREGDTRELKAALRRLEDGPEGALKSADSYLLRAQARQGLHDFRGALEDLDRLLRAQPRHAAAWLMKAAIHQVRGEFVSARKACLQLANCGDGFVTTVAAASLSGLTSVDGTATNQLTALLAGPGAAAVAPDIHAWAWVSLGELHALHGTRAAAEAAFRKALDLDPGDPYARTALADLLLVDDRPAEVIRLLRSSPQLNHRLRLAEAQARLDRHSPEARRLRRELEEYFELAMIRGEDLHGREHARFILHLQDNPAQALPLASANWAVQKEPADLELLIAAAEAAGDREVRATALDWAKSQMPAIHQRYVPNTVAQAP